MAGGCGSEGGLINPSETPATGDAEINVFTDLLELTTQEQ